MSVFFEDVFGSSATTTDLDDLVVGLSTLSVGEASVFFEDSIGCSVATTDLDNLVVGLST